jgi:hypothetical protein
LRIQAEIETADRSQTKRPTLAPPVVLEHELLELCRELEYLTPNDKPSRCARRFWRACCRDSWRHPGRRADHSCRPAFKHWFGYVVPEANLGARHGHAVFPLHYPLGPSDKVACDQLVVLDIDPRHDGDQSLAALEHECALPDTWRALTGGGGEHILFSCPEGVSIKNYSPTPGSEPPLGPGIDIRARGGYIVAVPSRHISGKQYAWSVDHHPQDIPLAPLPDWLIERLIAPRSGTRAQEDGTQGEPIPSDVWVQLTQRPVSEYRQWIAGRIAGHFFWHNCDYEFVRGMMHAWNSAWCKPPLGYHELDNIIGRRAIKRVEAIEGELDR